MIRILIIGVLVLLGSLYVAAVLLAMAPYLIIIIIGAVICIFVGGRSRNRSDPSEHIE